MVEPTLESINGLDLAIGPEVLVETQGRKLVRLDSQEDLDSIHSFHKLPMWLEPGERILLAAINPIRIPSNRIGFIVLRSTAARAGLSSPPTVADPDFWGDLTLELTNSSKRASFYIEGGLELFTLVLLKIEDFPSYDLPIHRYQGQKGVTGPKAFLKKAGVNTNL